MLFLISIKIHLKEFGFLTVKNELCYYKKGKISIYRFNHIIKKKFPSSTIADKEILIDKAGTLYFGLKNDGYITIDKKGKTKTFKKLINNIVVDKIENDYFISIYKNILNHTKSRIYFQKESGDKYQNFRDSITLQNKIFIASDQNNDFIIVDNIVYNLRNKKKILPKNNNVVICAKLFNNELWLGTIKNGIEKYQYKNGEINFKKININPLFGIKCFLKTTKVDIGLLL
jgi:ligand-binding sensor domain-containing protein